MIAKVVVEGAGLAWITAAARNEKVVQDLVQWQESPLGLAGAFVLDDGGSFGWSTGEVPSTSGVGMCMPVMVSAQR